MFRRVNSSGNINYLCLGWIPQNDTLKLLDGYDICSILYCDSLAIQHPLYLSGHLLPKSMSVLYSSLYYLSTSPNTSVLLSAKAIR